MIHQLHHYPPTNQANQRTVVHINSDEVLRCNQTVILWREGNKCRPINTGRKIQVGALKFFGHDESCYVFPIVVFAS